MRAPASRKRSWTWAVASGLVALLGAALALRSEPGRAGNAPPPPEHVAQVTSPAATPGAVRAPSSDRSPRPAQDRIQPAASEEDLIERLRADAEEHPAVAVSLADESERRFPDGPFAEERAYLKMRALVHLGDIVAARDAAERFFEQHPNSAFGRYVFRLTGMRPRPGPGM